MVQTLEQYILVHRAVKELFLEQMRVIDSHPYENVDDDGHPLVDNKEDTDYETVVVSYSQGTEINIEFGNFWGKSLSILSKIKFKNLSDC